MARLRPLAFGNEAGDVRLDLDGILASAPRPAPCEAADVGVDGDSGHAKRISEDDVRRLPSDAGKLDELFQGPRHLAAVVRAQRGGKADARGRLGSVEAKGMENVFELKAVRVGKGLRSGIGFEKARGDGVDSRVRGLRREDGGHQQLEGIRVIQCARGVGIERRQAAVYLKSRVLAGRKGPRTLWQRGT